MNKNERKGAIWLLAVIIVASLLPWGVKMCSVSDPPAQITVIANGDNSDDDQRSENKKRRKKSSKKGSKKRKGKKGKKGCKKKGKNKSTAPAPDPRDFLADSVPTS